MKNILLVSIAAAAILLSSCSGMMEMKRIDMVQVSQFEDSILKAQIVPGTASIHILQDDDYSKVTIIIRNSRLYADKDKVPQAAVRVGEMVLRVLGPNASISKATLAITQKDDDGKKIPDDGISADMQIDSLKKVIFPGK